MSIRERLEALGYLSPINVELEDGRIAWLRFNLLDSCDICFAKLTALEFGVEEFYTYADDIEAWKALILLNRNGLEEPDGWIRHMPSGRRRRDGDPAMEEVRP